MKTLYTNAILSEIYARGHDPDFAAKTAIHEAPGCSITYGELVSSVENLAKNLVANGLRGNDRILMLVRPNIRCLQIVLAVVRAGGTLVIADPAMGKAIFQERMALAQPQWVFIEGVLLALQKLSFIRHILRGRGVEVPEMGELAIPHVVTTGTIPFLGGQSLHSLLCPNTQHFQESERHVSDDITIVFTSGTTGKPKGVVHTVNSMLATLARVRDYATLTAEDVICDTGILFIIPTLMAGGTVVMRQGRFSAEKAVRTYRDFAVTKTLEVPTHMKAIADYLYKHDEKLPASLQDLMLGAAPVFADFLEQLQALVHPSTCIWSIYGMTELLPAALVSSQEKLAFDRNIGDLVGAPMHGISAEIAADGELLLSGAGLFDRYLGEATVTQHHTGDMACIDEKGRIVLLGRKKDMIIRGKHNIYPTLFEPIIRRIEGVNDAAMVGVYQPQTADEVIALFIESDMDLNERYIRECLLSGANSIDLYAQPDHIFFEPIPYSGRSLKMDKKALREHARQRLGIHADDKSELFEGLQ